MVFTWTDDVPWKYLKTQAEKTTPSNASSGFEFENDSVFVYQENSGVHPGNSKTDYLAWIKVEKK